MYGIMIIVNSSIDIYIYMGVCIAKYYYQYHIKYLDYVIHRLLIIQLGLPGVAQVGSLDDFDTSSICIYS